MTLRVYTLCILSQKNYEANWGARIGEGEWILIVRMKKIKWGSVNSSCQFHRLNMSQIHFPYPLLSWTSPHHIPPGWLNKSSCSTPASSWSFNTQQLECLLVFCFLLGFFELQEFPQLTPKSSLCQQGCLWCSSYLSLSSFSCHIYPSDVG